MARVMRATRPALFTIPLIALGESAFAYTISSPLSDGCHEAIATGAFRKVRAELATAAPLPLTEDEQAFVDDLPFDHEPDMGDLGGATLLVSVRDNDLKGRAAGDLSSLAEVHGDPSHQNEHCLRSEDDKEPGGSQAAVNACRAFIRQRAMEALAGLDAMGSPDLAQRTTLTIALALRGSIDVPLPTYYVRIGQAIHAVEDSFSHTYRSVDDARKITVVLNWLDQVNESLVESRDGPPHATALDACDVPDALRTTHRELAIDASAALLRATLDPQNTPDQKMATVDSVLDTYLGYMPGCAFDNHWCDAPESQFKDARACNCTVGQSAGDRRATSSIMALVLLAFAIRTRRRSARAGAVAMSLAAATVLASSDAQAQAQALPGDNTSEGHPPAPKKEPGPPDPNATAWGASASLAGAVDEAALATGVGGRLRLNKRWTFGVDAEWNPWIAYYGATFRTGVLNGYGTAILLFPLAYENFNLRTTANLGTSYLLMNLYGAPAGSLGLYGGLSFLGLESKVFRTFYLVIDPVKIALPVPHIRGVPLVYPQYRFTVSIEVYSG